MQDIQEKQNAVMGMKGFYRISRADVTTPDARSLESKIVALKQLRENYAMKDAKGIDNLIGSLIRELNARFGEIVFETPNLIPTVGRAVLAARLAGITTYTGIVNKVALGTSSSTPLASDTQLGTEVYRNTIASYTSASNIAYLTGFFTAAETSGTYSEVGLFIDGTASANTGQMFSHALASITKSSIQTLTIDWVVTIS